MVKIHYQSNCQVAIVIILFRCTVKSDDSYFLINKGLNEKKNVFLLQEKIILLWKKAVLRTLNSNK